MQISLARKIINSLFLSVFIILMLCTVIAYKQMQSLRESNSWVVHTHQVIESVDEIFLYSVYLGRVEMEYFVTKNPSYLIEYNSIKTRLTNKVIETRKLTIDNPSQQHQLDLINPVITQQISLTDKAFTIFQSQGTIPAITLLLSDRPLVDQIRKITSAMDHEELSLLRIRNSTSMQNSSMNNYIITIIISLSNILLFACYLYINNRERKYSTEQQRTNQMLEEQIQRTQEANRMKSEFLANMSHELRTPLNGIIGFSELMYYEKVGPISAQHKEYLGDILASSNHLLQLINDVLDLAKVEAGKMEFYPETIDIKKLITEACDILRTYIQKKRINMNIFVDPALTTVYIDPGKFKQVIYNYLSNAIKFTPEEGRIDIKASCEGDHFFRLTVKDTGIGIPKDGLTKLFEPFQQLDNSSRKKYAGTGLGLALTRQLVEAQGGIVGVESTIEKGSTFYATFPRTSIQRQKKVHKQQSALIAPVPDASGNAAKILIIEDDKSDQKKLIKTLTGAGFDIDVAATGNEALERATSRKYDAITLDLLLPDMNGWDVLHTLRQNDTNKSTPVIVVTMVAEKIAATGVMISDYLAKPVSANDLLAALRAAGVAPKSGKAKVLVIDDDQNAIKLATQMLVEHGYEVLCEPDGSSGLKTAERERPDGIILDLQMPYVNGFEFLLLYRGKEYGRTTPIIIWTIKELSAADIVKLNESAQAVVQKGNATMNDLLAELQHHIKRAQKNQHI